MTLSVEQWAAIGNFAIAAVGGLIAWKLFRLQERETKTAEGSFKLALFEKRFAVFRSLINLLRHDADWYHEGQMVPENIGRDMRKFMLEGAGATFLFDKKRNDYIAMVLRNLTQLATLEDEIRDEGRRASEEVRKQRLELKAWLRQSIPEAERVFEGSMYVGDMGL